MGSQWRQCGTRIEISYSLEGSTPVIARTIPLIPPSERRIEAADYEFWGWNRREAERIPIPFIPPVHRIEGSCINSQPVRILSRFPARLRSSNPRLWLRLHRISALFLINFNRCLANGELCMESY